MISLSPSGSASSLPTLLFVRKRQDGASRKMESLVAWIKVTQKRRVRVVDVDADRHPEVASKLDVTAVPALVLMSGGRVLGRLEGRSTGRQIDELIREHVSEDGETSPETRSSG